MKLFWDIAPLACENFATLCANGSAFGDSKGKAKPPPLGESGKPLTYRDSKVHRVIPGFILQGGDFVFGNGSGGESVFGKKFKDERAGLALKHDRKGILSMGNSGKNSNSSQFFFTFAKAPQCDGKHVIFGEVVSGWEVLEAAEKLGTTDGEPTKEITITDCGIFVPLETPACGYWFDQPDPDSYSGISPVFMIRPRVLILAPNDAVCKKFESAMKTFVSCTAIPADSSLEDDVAQGSKISELLGNFAVDVVILAPACQRAKGNVTLPQSWEGKGIGIEEVVLESKPVDALATIRESSWLTKRANWQLDGSAS